MSSSERILRVPNDGLVNLKDFGLPAGSEVLLTVVSSVPETHSEPYASLLDILGAASGMFGSADEIDDFIRHLRQDEEP